MMIPLAKMAKSNYAGGDEGLGLGEILSPYLMKKGTVIE